jgi:hypothetical protein
MGYWGELMLQQFPRKWCQRIVESRIEVEKARHHDEGYCGGSALPQHDLTKKERSDFGIINSRFAKKQPVRCAFSSHIGSESLHVHLQA